MLLENIKVITVSEVRSGKSKTTGRPYALRSVLLGFEDETGDSYMYAEVSDELWQSLGHHEGDIASLNIRFRTKKFVNGFISNDIRIVSPENLQ